MSNPRTRKRIYRTPKSVEPELAPEPAKVVPKVEEVVEELLTPDDDEEQRGQHFASHSVRRKAIANGGIKINIPNKIISCVEMLKVVNHA